MYKLPEFLYDEFLLIYYMYEHRWDWSKGIKNIDNYIKTEVKKHVLNSILKKIEDYPEHYTQLKTVLDKRPRFNHPGSFDNINTATIKYIFYLLHDVIKKTPGWIKDSIKYNL